MEQQSDTAGGHRLADAPHFERAVQLSPNDLETRLHLGTALAMLNRNAEAVSHFQAALQIDPDSAQAHFRLAFTLRSLGRMTESNDHYREAIRLDPRLGR